MKLPVFNPREVPSSPLSKLDLAAPVQLPILSKQILQDALSLRNDTALSNRLLNVALLRQDVLHIDAPRLAAVLIVLVERENDMDVVLTVRASHLRHHAGQISFVGGALEMAETPLEAGLREAREEIGLNTDVLDVLGELPTYHTITGFAVTPIVVSMPESVWLAQELTIDVQEVDHVFTVPLSAVLNHDCIHVHNYEWENQHRQYYSVTYGDYFIWGASMAMLRNLDLLLRAAYAQG